MKNLIIVRGLPGSGKSTYAHSLGFPHHFEADQYFEHAGGYKFDPSQIQAAHRYCQKATEKAMLTGEDIVVSNTFVKVWEMFPYVSLASKYGYDFKVVRRVGEFQNVHGVPPNVIEAMKSRFEDFPHEVII